MARDGWSLSLRTKPIGFSPKHLAGGHKKTPMKKMQSVTHMIQLQFIIKQAFFLLPVRNVTIECRPTRRIATGTLPNAAHTLEPEHHYVGYTSGLELHREMQDIQNTCGCCCTPAAAEHHRMELGIDQELGLQVGSRSVGVELELSQLVGIQEEAGCYRWGLIHQVDWLGLEQREHDPPPPCVGRPPPSYELSIPFGSP